MVTLRTYSNPMEAALAKSLLDDRKIFCSLADENANHYGGAPFAMPIRLLVAEEQVEEARRVLDDAGHALSDDFDSSTDNHNENAIEPMNQQILSELCKLRHFNQWILFIGVVILLATVYLVSELPRRTTPWSPISEAMRQYDYDRAVTLTKKIIGEHPDDYYGHEYLGNIYFAMGNLNQAESEYARAYELAPPEHLKSKLDAVRKRRDREARTQPSATPIPWP